MQAATCSSISIRCRRFLPDLLERECAAEAPEDPTLDSAPMSVDHMSLRGGTHIFSWGRGDLGQLGTGLDSSQPQPVLVQAVEAKDVSHVAASVFNSAFITGERHSSTSPMPLCRPLVPCACS